MIEIFFLGTGAGVPSKDRGLPCVVLRRKGELIMFDCGEGTQRVFLQTGLGVNRPMRIFISHLHGDHVLGLPGLLYTFSMLGRERPLEIYGPPGLRRFLEGVLTSLHGSISYEVRVYEVSEGTIVEDREYVVRAVLAEHDVPNLAYALEERPRPGRFHPERAEALGVPRGPLWKKLQLGEAVRLPDGRIVLPEQVLDPPRPGLKIVYSGDTRPCPRVVELAKGADVLIHDATYADSLREKAIEEFHSTAGEAAQVARAAGVRLLVLTHISARYSGNAEVLLRDAKRIFDNVVVAYDGMRLEVRERD